MRVLVLENRVLVLVLVLETQVLVLVLETQVLVLVLETLVLVLVLETLVLVLVLAQVAPFVRASCWQFFCKKSSTLIYFKAGHDYIIGYLKWVISWSISLVSISLVIHGLQ